MLETCAERAAFSLISMEFKRERAPLEGSLWMLTERSPCFVKKRKRNADTTEPYVAAKHSFQLLQFDFFRLFVRALGSSAMYSQGSPYALGRSWP